MATCDPSIVLATILIATRSRADHLDRCLTSIECDPSQTTREIIVVDNGSTDHTADVLAAHKVTALSLAKSGKCRALDLGIGVARGDIILFTDDDVTVEPGWIDALASAFAEPEVGAVGGRVIPRLEGGTRPVWMADGEELYRAITLWDEGTEPFRVVRGRSPVGANMAFRSAILPRNPFDPRFRHTGHASIGHDEWELFDRIADRHTVLYEPRAVVNHWLDVTRLSFDAVRSKVFQIAVGATRQRNLGQRLPTYPRRIVRTSRFAAAAIAARRQTRSRDLDSESALVELRAWQDAAVHMETLFSSAPRFSEWISTKI